MHHFDEHDHIIQVVIWVLNQLGNYLSQRRVTLLFVVEVKQRYRLDLDDARRFGNGSHVQRIVDSIGQ